MIAALTQRSRGECSGNLTEGQEQVCTRFLDLVHSGLAGRARFKDVILQLALDLSALRDFNYDVERAIASGNFSTSERVQVEPIELEDASSIRLTDSEKAFLNDVDGLINWVTRNGVSFSVITSILGHDLAELARDDFRLELTTGPGRCVAPKVTGWASRNAEPVGEADEQT